MFASSGLDNLQSWIPLPPESAADYVVVVFVILVTVITTWSLLIIRRRNAETRDWVGRLTQITAQLDPADLRASRGSALSESNAVGTAQEVAHLWREFDETLVDDSDGRSLQNTVDAREVFNSESLASGLVHSKGLAFIPSALTALGVLGTFLGLTLGLDGLQLGGETQADISELQNGIQQLIGGVSTAFLTSIFGVIGSLLVSFSRFRKISKRTRDIEKFQAQVDALFERHTPEQSLVGIERSSADSLAALNELHEKIGSKLQETVSGMATDMQAAVTNALQEAITPVLQTLSSTSNDQAAAALESLMERFESSFQEFGGAQADRLSEATAGLSASAESIDANLSHAVSAFAKQNDDTARMMHDAVQETASHFSEHQVAVAEQTNSLIEAMKQERALSLEITSELSRLVTESGESMKASSHALQSSSRDVRSAADNWKKSAEDMDTQRQAFTADLDAIVSAQQKSITQLDSHEARLREVALKIKEATQSFAEAAKHNKEAAHQVRESQNEFLKEQQTNVESLRSQMRDWLEDYRAQVSSHTTQRMDEWNQHSHQYASYMRDIAIGLADVVEDLSSAQNGKATHQ